VLSQLALNEYDANLTLRDTKNMNILVSIPRGDMYRLEVKTSVNKPSRANDFGYCLSWRMDIKHETIKDKFPSRPPLLCPNLPRALIIFWPQTSD